MDRLRGPSTVAVRERLPGPNQFAVVAAWLRSGDTRRERVVEFSRNPRRRYEVRVVNREGEAFVGWVEREFEAGGAIEEQWVIPRRTLIDRHPRHLTVGPDGAIYVCAMDEVMVYEWSGARRGALCPRGAAFMEVSAMVARGDGAVCVADAEARFVLLFQHGEESAWYEECLLPVAMCVLPSGEWLVSDTGSCRVVRLGADDLALQGVFAETVCFTSLVAAADGTVLAASQRCFVVYAADGTRLRQVGSSRPAPADLLFPLAVTPGARGPVVLLRRHDREDTKAWEVAVADAQALVAGDVSSVQTFARVKFHDAAVDAAGRVLVYVDGGVMAL